MAPTTERRNSKTWIGRVTSAVTQRPDDTATPKNLQLDQVFVAAYLTAKWQQRLAHMRDYFFTTTKKDTFKLKTGEDETYDPLFGDEGSTGKGEREVWSEAFRFFDLDGSGDITVQEMVEKVNIAGCKVALESIEKFLKEADFDHSGTVDKQEFLVYVSQKTPRTKIFEAAKEVFDAMDTDKSGAISAEELAEAMHEFGETVDQEEANQLLKELDTDGDGQVQFGEFCALLGAVAPPVTMKMTNKKGANFYFRAASGFLKGTSDGKPPTSKLTISALGNAISIASEVAGRVEKDGSGTIVGVKTFQQLMGQANAVGVEIVISGKAHE